MPPVVITTTIQAPPMTILGITLTWFASIWCTRYADAYVRTGISQKFLSSTLFCALQRNESASVTIRPAVDDRDQLFNRKNFELSGSGRAKRRIPSRGSLPSGLQRFYPTEMRKVPHMRHIDEGVKNTGDGGGLIEEVERFRFIVDEKELKRALETGTSMRVKQSRGDGADTTDMPDLVLDASIVQSLAIGEKSTSMVDPLKYSLEMDHDDFVKGIASADDKEEEEEERYGENTRIATGYEYSEETMAEAEKVIEEGTYSSFNSPEVISKQRLSARLIRYAAVESIRQSLLLTPKQEVASSLVGTGFITLLSIAVIAVFDLILRTAQCIFAYCWKRSGIQQHSLGTVLKTLQQRHAVPWMLIAVGAAWWFHTYYIPWRKRREFNWIGYTVPS